MIKYMNSAGKEEKFLAEEYRRHDISDRMWKLLKPHLPRRPGAWGRVAQDSRRFVNAVIWILRTGATWRDLPPDYGNCKNNLCQFSCWVIMASGKNCSTCSFETPILSG